MTFHAAATGRRFVIVCHALSVKIGTSQGWLTYQSDLRPRFGLGDAVVAEVVRIE